jgi:hypothetical protein
MPTYYKLVDSEGYTRRGSSGETLWLPVEKKVKPKGIGTEPCGPGVLHLYNSATEAALYNPLHANISNPRLLQVSVSAKVTSDGLKLWTKGAVTVKQEIALPLISTTQRVAWAIVLTPHASTRQWAVSWLLGNDRSAVAAYAARAAYATAHAAHAAYAAAYAAADADAAAADAAAAAARADAAAYAAYAAAARADAAAARADAFHEMSLAAFARAGQILAGSFSAERYDEPL